MKLRNVFIVALCLFYNIANAQDSIYSIVKGESVNPTSKPHYFRVISRDSVSNKKVVIEYAVTRIHKSELVTKKGESILPEAGDWAISIDASPFIRYIGNIIGSNGLNSAPTFSFLSDNQTILGKYYIEAGKAYRLGLRLGFGSNSSTTKVSFLPIPTPMVYVDDVINSYHSTIGLTAGMEWRKGKSRLQGFYGAEAGLVFGSSSIHNTYGNRLSPYNPVYRTVEMKTGDSFSLGARGFIGVEYFIFPKIAIGGEFGWGIALQTVGEGTNISEYWDSSTSTVKTNTIPIGGSTSFGFDSDNLNSVFGPAGTLRLTLHF